MSEVDGGSVAILLLPGFSMASLGVLTDRLTTSSGRAPRIQSFHEEMVASEHGIRVHAGALPGKDGATSRTLIVCGGRQSLQLEPEQRTLLFRIGSESNYRIGIGSGVIALAQARLLGRHRCSAPEGLRSELQRLEPQLLITPGTFTRDDRVWTCSGEKAVPAMLDALIPDCIADTGIESGWSRSEQGNRFLLSEAQTLMRNNVAEPLTTAEIASYLGITSKKLERIFRRFAGQLPARFYLGLRLLQAREMLHHSSCSIEEIGNRCGFGSASHFSRAFRNYFGCPPRVERQRFMIFPQINPEFGVTNDKYLAG